MRILCAVAACAALALHAEDKAVDAQVDPLVKGLGADEFSVRKDAENKLRALGFPAFKKLRTFLDSDDAEIRSRVRAIIGNYDEIYKLIADLEKDLRKDLYSHEKTKTQLELIAQGSTAVPYIADRLTREAGHLYRFNCATILNEIATPSAAEVLRKLTTDPHAWVRTESVWSLGNLRDTDGVKAVADLLKDADKTVRHEALLALSKIAGVRMFAMTPMGFHEFSSDYAVPEAARKELDRLAAAFLEKKEMPEADKFTGRILQIPSDQVLIEMPVPTAEMKNDDWEVKTYSNGKERYVFARLPEEFGDREKDAMNETPAEKEAP